MSNNLKTPTALTPCRRMGLSRNISKTISPAVLSPLVATNQIVVDITPKSSIPRTVSKSIESLFYIYLSFFLNSPNPPQLRLIRLKKGNYPNKVLLPTKMPVHRLFQPPGSLCRREAIDNVYR